MSRNNSDVIDLLQRNLNHHRSEHERLRKVVRIQFILFGAIALCAFLRWLI